MIVLTLSRQYNGKDTEILRDQRVLGAKLFLSYGQSPDHKRLGHIVLAHIVIEPGQIIEAGSGTWMCRPKHRLSQSKRSFVERFGEIIFALIEVNQTQGLQVEGQIRMQGTIGLLVCAQGLNQKRLGPDIIAGVYIILGQVAQSFGHLGVVYTCGCLQQIEGTLIQNTRVGQTALFTQTVGQSSCRVRLL